MAKLDNEILANKNEVDIDEFDKNEAETDIIASFVTLKLQKKWHSNDSNLEVKSKLLLVIIKTKRP